MHRLLDGTGQQPSYQPVSALAFYLSRMCEEFPGTVPSEIMAERARLPDGLLDEIVASRNYARAYAANQADPKGFSASELRTAVFVIEGELAQDDIDHGK